LKTAQCSLFEDSSASLVTLPPWGMMQNGVVWALTKQERPTYAKDYGYWQTPVSDDSLARKDGKVNSRGEPKLSAQVLRTPTPCASDWKNGRGKTGNRSQEKKDKAGLKLNEFVNLNNDIATTPTPRAFNLVSLIPTPQSRDYFPPHSLEYSQLPTTSLPTSCCVGGGLSQAGDD